MVSPVSSASATAGLYQVDLDLTPQYQVLGGLDVIYEKKGGFARSYADGDQGWYCREVESRSRSGRGYIVGKTKMTDETKKDL